MDKLKLPREGLKESELSFVPVKNTGKSSFSLCLAGDTLYLITKGEKYRITLIKEEK